MTHDLEQQENYLRAALEQEKKPLGFLIGAGAPLSIRVDNEPLVPDLVGLTELVLQEIDKKLAPALNALVAQLPPDDRSNLEVILNYVRALAALPGAEDVRGIDVETLGQLDTAICAVIRKTVNKNLPDDENGYFALALWVSAVRRLIPTQIFTTNYDLLVEQALEKQQVPYFDGFMGSREPTFDIQAVEEDQLPSRWTLLWKLHGSINWTQDGQGNVVRHPADADDESSALVYPSHLKYDQSRRLPYLAMMDRLKAFLRRPGAILVTTGYSFRDQHINEVIDQSLRANATASVQGLLFGNLEGYGDAVELAGRLPNLILIASDAGVVGSLRSKWTPISTSGESVESKATSGLGDFANLGMLLRNLTGELPQRVNVNE